MFSGFLFVKFHARNNFVKVGRYRVYAHTTEKQEIPPPPFFLPPLLH